MHTPTEEQAAIVEAARSSDRNLLVSALAGAAKTSTLELIAQALPSTEILALAFNKKMAVEMQERMPSNVKAMTLNALGHRVWMDATGRRLKINASKTYDIAQPLAMSLRSDVIWEQFAELLRIIDFGKACGYIPSATSTKRRP
jgi:F-box protein 18 (helicase)